MKQQPVGIIPPLAVAETGRALFGPVWQMSLAKAMKVQDQAMRRWTNDGCPTDMAPRMRQLLAARAEEISRAILTLDEYPQEK